MKSYTQLIDGYKAFREDYHSASFTTYRKQAAVGQQPKTMVISCSDSRINAAIMTQAELGDLFLVSNVANIVPSYEQSHIEYGTISAIEYAVKHLKVQDIIIMGHSNCGGVRTLFKDISEDQGGFDYIRPWVSPLVKVKDRIVQGMHNATDDEKIQACEQGCIVNSLNNLAAYPYVKEAVADKRLNLHAWYFNLADSELYEYQTQTNQFVPIR